MQESINNWTKVKLSRTQTLMVMGLPNRKGDIDWSCEETHYALKYLQTQTYIIGNKLGCMIV